MPAPMYLIQKPLLTTIAEEAKIGVPHATLVTKYSLPITPPTLSKLIKHMRAYLDCVEPKSQAIIEASLFPNWLMYRDQDNVVRQPTTYKYDGKFPLGRWIKC